MPTYQINSPDGHTYQVTAPDGASQADVLNYVQQQHSQPTNQVAGNPNGPQPTFMDKVLASPGGRAIHDAVVAPIEGISSLANKVFEPNTKVPGVGDYIEPRYQAALSANRNTPGYATALQTAQANDARNHATGSSRFTDQLTAPFLPSIKSGLALALSGGNIDAANAAADVQASSQANYQKQHPVASFLGQMMGGLLATPESAQTIPSASPTTTNPTIDSINQAKNAAYSVVDNSPMRISAPEIQQLHSDIASKLERMGLNEQTMPKLTPKVDAAMQSLGDAAASDQTLQGMDIQRRIAGIAAGSPDRTERAAARIVQDGIDDFIGNLKPSQLSGPVDQAAIDALPEARDLASRSFKAQQLQAIIDKAKNNSTGFAQSGYENALRSGFRKLLNNDRAIARFSPDEVAAIKQVATGGSPLSATNLLRQVGKLSPQGAVPILAEMGAYGAFGPHALAAPAAGIAGRAGATMLQNRAANAAVNLALSGSPAVGRSLLAAPAITARSTVPFGLLGSGLISPQSSQ